MVEDASCSPWIEDIQVERLLTKRHRLLAWDIRRSSSAENCVSVLIGFPHTVLDRPSPIMVREFRFYIFEEDYSYFSNRFEKDLDEELPSVAYYTHQASIILSFSASRQGEIFLFDRVRPQFFP